MASHIENQHIREHIRNEHFQPFELGWRAGLRRADKKQNPYPGGSQERAVWERWRVLASQYLKGGRNA